MAWWQKIKDSWNNFVQPANQEHKMLEGKVEQTSNKFSDTCLLLFMGKQLAIVGERATGKSRLIDYLTKRELAPASDYSQTLATEHRAKSILKHDETRIGLGAIANLSGSEDAVEGEWKDAIKKAEAVLYLVRADWLMSEDANIRQDHENRIKSDFDKMETWFSHTYKLYKFEMSSHKLNFRTRSFTIVITHCDKLPEYYLPNDASKPGENFRSKLINSPVLVDSITKMTPYMPEGRVNRVAGSLLTVNDADQLEEQILSALKWHYIKR